MTRIFLALFLLVPLLSSPVRAADHPVIEAALFEGGAGKDWFLYSARAFELQGKWSVTLTSPAGTQHAALTVSLTNEDLGRRFAEHDLTATLAFGGLPPNLPLVATNRDTFKTFRGTAADGAALVLTSDGATVSGSLTTKGGTWQISGTKPNPVTVDCYLDPRIQDKMRVRYLEGSFPNITNGLTTNYWPLIHNGDIIALNSYLDSLRDWHDTSSWRDSFLPGTLDPYSEDGQVYGIPLGYYPNVIWFNRKLFAENGWQPPKTWDELFALCEAIKKTGMAPFAFQGRYADYARALYDHGLYQIGGPDVWADAQLLRPGAFSTPAGLDAIRMLRTLSKNYFQTGAFGMSHTEAQLEFFLGHTAMVPCGAWLKSEMLGKIPDGFRLGCFNLPVPNNPKADPSTLFIRVEPFFTFAKPKYQRETIDFLRFMTSRRLAARFARMQDTPTAIKGTNQGNLSSDLDDLAALITDAKASYGIYPGQPYPEMEQVYSDKLYEIIARHDLSPEQVATNLETVATSLRNSYADPNLVVTNHRLKPALLLTLLGGGLLLATYRITRPLFNRKSQISNLKATTATLPRLSLPNTLLFLGPAVVLYTLFVIIPSARSFSWSMHRWNGLTSMADMPFVGLLNFRRLLLESTGFWTALGNNLFIMFVVPAFVIPLALLLAAAISRGVVGSKFFRVVFFFPNLIGGVAATLLWLHLYNPQGGLVNTFLTSLGLSSFDGFAWLSPPHLHWALVPISVWGACGFNMVLYLAAMESIPESYYEAATIDGASPLRQFFTITLPLIREVLAISAVFLVIGGMKAFEIIWLLTGQRPPTANHVVATRMVQTMFQEFRVGEAAALAVLLFLMIFAASATTLKFTRRKDAIEM